MLVAALPRRTPGLRPGACTRRPRSAQDGTPRAPLRPGSAALVGEAVRSNQPVVADDRERGSEAARLIQGACRGMAGVASSTDDSNGTPCVADLAKRVLGQQAA